MIHNILIVAYHHNERTPLACPRKNDQALESMQVDGDKSNNQSSEKKACTLTLAWYASGMAADKGIIINARETWIIDSFASRSRFVFKLAGRIFAIMESIDVLSVTMGIRQRNFCNSSSKVKAVDEYSHRRLLYSGHSKRSWFHGCRTCGGNSASQISNRFIIILSINGPSSLVDKDCFEIVLKITATYQKQSPLKREP
jgi:hypothetical protein